MENKQPKPLLNEPTNKNKESEQLPKEQYSFYELGAVGVDPMKNEDFPPIITVCLLMNEKGIISRGISIKSALDKPNKDGNIHALKMARRANGLKSNCGPVTTIDAWRQIAVAGLGVFESSRLIAIMGNKRGPFYKGQYKIAPANDHELRIMGTFKLPNTDTGSFKEAA